MSTKNKIEFYKELALKISEIFEHHIYQAVIFNHDDPREDDLLVIPKVSSFEQLTALKPVVKSMIKKNIPSPYIMTREYILSSLDSFPLEFLNIRSDYCNLICEEDILKDLHFDKKHIRLQTERELKSKYILINNALLSISSSLAYENLTRESILSIKPTLKGILFLYGESIPNVYEEILQKVEHSTHLDLPNISKAFKVAHKEIKISKNEWNIFYKSYLDELSALITHIDEKIQSI